MKCVKKKVILALTLCFMNVSQLIPPNIIAAEQPASIISKSVNIVKVEPSTEEFIFDAQKGEITKYTGEGGEVKIPSEINGVKVKSIGESAFRLCTSLKKIIIPEGVVSIGSGAFDNCTELTSVKIPKSVTSTNNSFSGCDSLKIVELPDTITTIGETTFGGCISLKSIIIPKSVTSIGKAAFSDCYALKVAFFEGDAPSDFGSNVFDNTSSKFSIYYVSKAKGFTSPTWNGYKTKMICFN